MLSKIKGALPRSRGSIAWWGALVVILAFAVVAKTGTVGAPVMARTLPDAAPPPRPVLFADVRRSAEHTDALKAELALLRSQLAFEQRRSALLAQSVDALNARAAEPVSVVSAGDRLPEAPAPIEAIFVRPSQR